MDGKLDYEQFMKAFPVTNYQVSECVAKKSHRLK